MTDGGGSAGESPFGGDTIEAWSTYNRIKNLGAGQFGAVYLVEGVSGTAGLEGQHVVKRIPITGTEKE
eukprot:gene24435-10445_t